MARPGPALLAAPRPRGTVARPECRHGVVASNTSAGAVAIAVTAATAQASLVEKESESKRWKQWKASKAVARPLTWALTSADPTRRDACLVVESDAVFFSFFSVFFYLFFLLVTILLPCCVYFFFWLVLFVRFFLNKLVRKARVFLLSVSFSASLSLFRCSCVRFGALKSVLHFFWLCFFLLWWFPVNFVVDFQVLLVDCRVHCEKCECSWHFWISFLLIAILCVISFLQTSKKRKAFLDADDDDDFDDDDSGSDFDDDEDPDQIEVPGKLLVNIHMFTRAPAHTHTRTLAEI